MPDLLLELLSEEIPARMQARAAEDLRRMVTDALVEAGLTYEAARAYATPRRLALDVRGVSARSADLREERKGPRVGAPDKAVEGFLRAAGLSSLEEAVVRSEPRKGDFYVAIVERPGREALSILAEVLPGVIRSFPWPKSMRWGARSAPPDSPFAPAGAQGTGSVRWVRPIRSILCTFGPETETPDVVRFEVGGVEAGDVTFGHRFMAPDEPIKARHFDDYVKALDRAHVVLDGARRAAIVEAEAKSLAFAQGLELVEDEGLLQEVAGLVEWPVALMGSFDEAYLELPAEVIRLTIRNNQKCFVARRLASPPHPAGASQSSAPSTLSPQAGRGKASPLAGEQGEGPGALTNRFILVANIEAKDGGRAIVEGNRRVIAARLADARFFWEQDRKQPLEAHADKLSGIVFHEKLGSQAERVERIARLARELAPLVGADADDSERAARLAKADLVTGMVGEFPELQGVMGRYYYLAEHGLWPEASSVLSHHPAGASRSSAPSTLSQRTSGVPDVRSQEQRDREHPISRGRGKASPSLGEGEQGEGASDRARIRAVADAIRDHYKPQGPDDQVPTEPVAVAVALADKLDTLVGFWAIDEKPTGSKDPYALRRAALGVIRITLQNSLKLTLSDIFLTALKNGIEHYLADFHPLLYEVREDLRNSQEVMSILKQREESERELWRLSPDPEAYLTPIMYHKFDIERWKDDGFCLVKTVDPLETGQVRLLGEQEVQFELRIAPRGDFIADLLAFFADRLKVHLREEGARHDLIDAVFALPGQDDLLMIVRRVEALGRFLDTEDGQNLLTGYRRAANILRIEERKDGRTYDEEPDHALIHKRGQGEERRLLAIIESVEAHLDKHLKLEDFEGAMGALAQLRPAVDAFFDHVTVNVEDAGLRANRLRLLNRIRQAMHLIADFSKVGG